MAHYLNLIQYHKSFWSCHSAVIILVCLLIISGCGPSRPKQFRIDGKITFDGAPPPADGSIYFALKKPAEGFPAREAMARSKKVTAISPSDQAKTTTG